MTYLCLVDLNSVSQSVDGSTALKIATTSHVTSQSADRRYVQCHVMLTAW